MSIYLGNNKIKLPYSKAYVGNILVYQNVPPKEEIHFTTSLAPTTWTITDANRVAEATNSLGKWTIYGDTVYSSAYPINYAFDTSAATYYRSTDMNNNNQTRYFAIKPPVEMKPKTISINTQHLGNSTTPPIFQGLNANTGLWENIKTLDIIGTQATKNYTITTNNYYSEFRITAGRYNTNVKSLRIYDFKITEGYYLK